MIAELLALVAFLAGIALVIWSVEVFIEAVARSALRLGISGFFLAVILAGVDLENGILGAAAAVWELPDLALGTVFGEAIFVLAVAVGLAGVLVPFQTEVPRTYLLLTLLVPIPMFVLAFGGSLEFVDGVVLTAIFFPLLGLLYVLESRTRVRYVIDEEVVEAAAELGDPEAVVADGDGPEVVDGAEDEDGDGEQRSGLYSLGVAILAVVGMTVGSGLAVVGAEGLLAAYGLSGLAFGATVMSFIASLEELFLTVEPVRQGRPEIAVGNVVGSTLFYVTANAGVIALLHPIDTGGVVLTVHWPFFIALLVLVAAMLYRGRVTRLNGLLLLVIYVGYWVANYL
ncbi:sodium:calcium antiporter [Natrialbaceae archaeon A-gly3]